ncbi:EAL domain-containing protein [Corticibacter populi]|uniref:EAL domain-containing protein n=1 Tax=Corticibacter populi TaxID=1550736 RepID=A0A3M6QUU6_9BURK|nr:EAL domain-containing protein [Corticibacter populi]RMX06329.1 EAL domain-containing protein [Corticibacter populi]RZS32133.1 diguanylate cyclase/phosphodiesterase with PAS/PAC sensor(s) [Corticibacter populi]
MDVLLPGGTGLGVALRALDGLGVAALALDGGGHIQQANRAACRLLGDAAAALQGRCLQDWLVLSDAAGVRTWSETRALLASGRAVPLWQQEAVPQVVSVAIISVGAGAGRLDLLVLQPAEPDAVSAAGMVERLLRMAVEHSEQPVVVLDERRRIVYVNASFTSMFGYTLEEVRGRNPESTMLSGNLPPEEWVRHASLPWGQTRFQAEMQVCTKSGRDIWIRIATAPMTCPGCEDAAAGLHGYSVDMLTDITEERQIRQLSADVFQALVSNLSFDDWGERLCKAIQGIVPDVLVSLLSVDADHCLQPWAVQMLPAPFVAATTGMVVSSTVGSCGAAVARRARVLSPDIASDPLWSGLAPHLLEHGLRACWSYPVKRRDGSVAGTLALYSRQCGGPSAFHERVVRACLDPCALAVEREEQRQQMARLVQFDSLTGLPNRSRLLQQVDQWLAAPRGSKMAFFCLDVDRFKDVNDLLGHAHGDRVLVELANRLQGCLGAGEFVSRTEGDQFIVVLGDCDAHGAALRADQIRHVLAQPIEVAEQELNLTVSMGISHYPDGGANREDLLANAKAAMYRAKRAGGDRSQFFCPHQDRMLQTRLQLGAALRRAIAQQTLRLHYQPQVHAGSGLLHGMEALARWHDDSVGEVSPEVFIELAEDLGLIEAIDHWALREACLQLAQWRAVGLAIPSVSVNLSPHHFRDAALPDFIAGLLSEHGLPGSSLTVEITENSMLTMDVQMIDVARRIRALGVGLSVDDFGTGFSSLSNLVALPVTEVKIDRSFIDQSLETPRLQSLVASIIEIGRKLRLVVVAEGVETAAQRSLLLQHRCPVLQGYLFSAALPPHQVPQWLAGRQEEQPPSP